MLISEVKDFVSHSCCRAHLLRILAVAPFGDGPVTERDASSRLSSFPGSLANAVVPLKLSDAIAASRCSEQLKAINAIKSAALDNSAA